MSNRIVFWASLCLLGLLAFFCNNDSAMDNSRPPVNQKPVTLQADNPKVQNIVSQVDPDSLQWYIAQLVGFFTRHTNSDTASTTRGIGAARRWVFNRFKEISQKNGGRLRVSYHTFQATVRGVDGLHSNVIAELPGTETPDRKFVVSGHLDSRNRDNNDAVNFAPGANDDGSGVAAVMELARILSQFEFKSTIIFVAFTGEEQGLFGSRAYAAELRQNGENIVGMVTNDVVGNIVGGSGKVDSLSVRCFSDNPTDSPHRQLARFIKLQGEAYLSNFTVNLIAARDRPGRGGDHFSFNEQGYTAARLTEPEDNLQHQHNMADLPEFMSFPYLAKVVRINAAYLSGWADAPESPSNVVAIPQSEGRIKITWSGADLPQIADMLIGFRDPASATYDSLIAIDQTNEFVLESTSVFANGVFLSVSAVDQEKNESVFSNEVFIEKASNRDAK